MERRLEDVRHHEVEAGAPVIGRLATEMDASNIIELRVCVGAFHSNGIDVRADNEPGAASAGDARENARASTNIQHRHAWLLPAKHINRSGA